MDGSHGIYISDSIVEINSSNFYNTNPNDFPTKNSNG